jgi:hypothetical protein
MLEGCATMKANQCHTGLTLLFREQHSPPRDGLQCGKRILYTKVRTHIHNLIGGSQLDQEDL